MKPDSNTVSLTLTAPEELGLCPIRWQQILETAASLTENGSLPGLSLQVQRFGHTTGVHCFGSQRIYESIPVDQQTLFLVASLTKPMIAMAILLLAERGQLGLNQRVIDFLPDFRDAPKRQMTIRNLLTHTSGLPDMLPDNLQLRRSQSPLSAFVNGTIGVDLSFPVGRGAQYQSMGYALLGAIIDVVTGKSCQDFMRQEVFEPLGMNRTWLGLPASMRKERNIAEIRVPPEQRGHDDWNWNSHYWRELGAPWGGVLSTTEDLSRFLGAMLGGSRLFSPAGIQEACSNHLKNFPAVSDHERRTRGWGLGWRLNWKEHRNSLCELLPASVCGHWGATGALFWFDPQSKLGVVLLSSQPVGETYSPLSRLSNMVAAALHSKL